MDSDRLALPIEDFNPTRRLKTEVRRLLDGTCLYCGCKPIHLTVDHVIPVANGGQLHRSNLVPACRPCNLSKGNTEVFHWWRQQTFYCHSKVTLMENILGR